MLGRAHRRAGASEACAHISPDSACLSLAALGVCPFTVIDLRHGDNYMLSPVGPPNESADVWVVVGPLYMPLHRERS